MAVEHPEDTLIVYNPLNKPFTVRWSGISRTLPPHGTGQYPRYLAEHIAKHLADFVLQVKEYQYKKAHGKEVNLMRNTKERTKVLTLIIRGVASYFMPEDTTGLQISQQLSDPTADEVKSMVEVGDLTEDDIMGVTMDSIEIADVPEGRAIGNDSSKQDIMEQLKILGVEFSDRETKPELLAKLGVVADASSGANLSI